MNKDSDIKKESLPRAIKCSADCLAGSGSVLLGAVPLGHTTGPHPALTPGPRPSPSPLERWHRTARNCSAQLCVGTRQACVPPPPSPASPGHTQPRGTQWHCTSSPVPNSHLCPRAGISPHFPAHTRIFFFFLRLSLNRSPYLEASSNGDVNLACTRRAAARLGEQLPAARCAPILPRRLRLTLLTASRTVTAPRPGPTACAALGDAKQE